MCGRARLASDYSEIKIALALGSGPGAPAAPNFPASWNIAPTQDMLCVMLDGEGKRVAVTMRWGLIPRWAKEPKMKYPTFNAKAETVSELASFRGAWKAGRRCLVVTDGFYEWRKGDKQPFAIARVNDALTVMAGLWEDWTGPTGEHVRSCTVITTDANELLAPIHNRMPVILDEADWAVWLGEAPARGPRVSKDAGLPPAGDAALKALLRPFPSEAMHLWPVDKRVGNVRNNDPTLVAEVAI